MKVFLSHSTKDKQFVQTLADELKAENIEPWLCEVDVEFGENFVAKIEEGLRDADLAVLFWSPDAAVSRPGSPPAVSGQFGECAGVDPSIPSVP